MSEPRNAKYDLKQVREISCLGTFDDFATEALPYWIERAVRLEKALERACKFVEDVTGNCPLGLDRDFGFDYCEEHCINDFAGCWKEYFLEGDSDAGSYVSG